MKCLLFSLVILPISVLAEGGLPDKPYIYVKGTAEIKKPADMVILHFDLVGRAPDQPKANEEVQSKANKILDLLKERKIPDNDIIAEDLRSEPEYEQDEQYSRGHTKLIGYKVTRPFQVKVRDVPAFPKLSNDLIGIQGVEFSGIDSGLQKQKEVETDTWDKALTNARERAEKTLKSLEMRIDSIFAVSPVAFPEIEREIFGPESTVAGMRGGLAERADTAPQYRVAPITVTQEVHVIYLISPAK